MKGASSISAGSIAAGWLGHRAAWVALLVLAFLTLGARNLPWRLDDGDQARQAYVAFEMVHTGEVWFNHTPRGRMATKPPLLGWLSALSYRALDDWDLALRLPSFAAALAIAAALWRLGRHWAPWGGALAVAAFAFNMLSQRLATLVRTDMLLAATVFGAGALILLRVRDGSPWTAGQRVLLGVFVAAGLFAKGPVFLAFLVPGLLAFLWIGRSRGFRVDAGGWASWVFPVLLFGAWALIGLATREDFYEQIVVTEFAARFAVGADAVHDPKPVYAYLLPLVHRFAPWSALLIALAVSRPGRAALRREPALLWLLCWSLGGLLCLSLVPSKRLDRVFPVVPPLCLLLPGLLVAALSAEWGRRWRPVAQAAVAAGVLVSAGYTAWCVAHDDREQRAGLRHFAEGCVRTAAARGGRVAVVGEIHEGLLLYARELRFVEDEDLRDGFQRGAWSAAIVLEPLLDRGALAGDGFARVASSPPGFAPYACIVPAARAEEASLAPSVGLDP